MFPKVNWSWMDIRSSKRVWITGPSIKFIGHSHTPQRRCSRFLLVIWSSNEQLFFWTKPIFTGHCHMSDGPWEWLVFKRESPQKPTKPIRSSTNGTTVTFLTWYRHFPRKIVGSDSRLADATRLILRRYQVYKQNKTWPNVKLENNYHIPDLVQAYSK